MSQKTSHLSDKAETFINHLKGLPAMFWKDRATNVRVLSKSEYEIIDTDIDVTGLTYEECGFKSRALRSTTSDWHLH